MEKVRLEIELHEYKRLALVIRDHKSMLYKLSMHELIRRDLVRDMDFDAAASSFAPWLHAVKASKITIRTGKSLFVIGLVLVWLQISCFLVN